MAKRAVCRVCDKYRLIYLEGVELDTASGRYWFPAQACRPCALVLEAMIDDDQLKVHGERVETARMFAPA